MANTLILGRGTTPLYTIKINGIDLSTITDVYITFEQRPLSYLTWEKVGRKLGESWEMQF